MGSIAEGDEAVNERGRAVERPVCSQARYQLGRGLRDSGEAIGAGGALELMGFRGEGVQVATLEMRLDQSSALM